MQQQDIHVFQGLKRDNNQINQDSKFLWDALNIRLTARDNDTMLSLTNEKGTLDTGLTFEGSYFGHCTIGNYIIVFTSDINKSNWIYRVEKIGDKWYNTLLYYDVNNSLEFDPTVGGFQSLSVYEGNLVQKIYWVDGKNSPRVINVVQDKLKNISLPTTIPGSNNIALNDYKTYDFKKVYPSGFDFIPSLNLNETITITKEFGVGSFSAGTIQYAFTYYNKYGSESNIFYVTPLYYISYKDRGGSPEDNIANVFKGSIMGFETKFDYIRVYSIHRTSLDSIPTVKIVVDLKTSDGSGFLSFIDNGTTGSVVDPTQLLYIGGEDIIASTITEKDNTLFLGNIKIKRPQIDKAKELLKDSKKITIKDAIRSIDLSNQDDSFYSYSSELNNEDPSSFKANENYRLGVQFQYKNGKWSEPVFLQNYTVGNNHPWIYNKKLYLNSIKCELPVLRELKDLGYKKVRPVVVLPSTYDRRILAQGILNPTVFSVKDRLNNTPFSQASWFFRPMEVDQDLNTINTNNKNGAVVSYRPYERLLGTVNRGAEIQNMDCLSLKESNDSAINNDKVSNDFYVDQSILTFHSPDIEFDTKTQLAINNENLELKIVGVVPFKYTASDIDIITSSSAPAPLDTGFYHTSFLTSDDNRIMASGLFYKSHAIDSSKDSDRYVYAPSGKDTTNKYELNWMIYPWHRTGSLNNDVNRSTGTRTSELKRKVISNLRYSDATKYTDLWSSNNANGITAVSLVNSNEVSLTKIPVPKNSTIENLNYYGNVDTLVTTQRYYNFYYKTEEGTTINNIKDNGNTDIGVNFTDGDKGLYQSKDPVRMKYKTTPHAVFALNYSDNGSPIVLPYLQENNKTINKSPLLNDTSIDKFFWDNTVIESIPSSSISVNIMYLTNTYDTMDLQNKYTPSQSATNNPDTGKLAIYTSEKYLSNHNYAELWIVRVDTHSMTASWNWYKTTPKENSYYSYTENGVTSYWKTVKDGDDLILKRIFTSNDKALIKQDKVTYNGTDNNLLYLAELRRIKNNDNLFGGDSKEALKENQWIPAGEAVTIMDNNTTDIEFIHGDTYYQRYDCLKTYPFTTEDLNSVVDIASFMCETRINIDGRYDRNRGQLSNLNMTPINFNLMNTVYSQKDNFFNYRILDDDYYRTTDYPSQIIWSLEKTNMETIDKWTSMTLANSYDLSGANGELTSLVKYNDLLIAFQKNAVNQVLFNSRVQISTSDNNPIEISNNYKMEGARVISNDVGCQDKEAITTSPMGIYFIDNNSDTLYLFNGQLNALSDTKGFKWYLRSIHSDNSWCFEKNVGVRLNYDPLNKDLYICPPTSDALCYSELLGQCTSLMSYGDTVLFPLKDDYMSLALKDDGNSNLILSLWENFKGDYNSFYGNTIMPYFTYICNNNPTITKVFDTIEYESDVYDKNNKLQSFKSFDWIEAYNEYQQTRKEALVQKRKRIFNIDDNKLICGNTLRKKFRVWRALIPREGRQRMRNPWTAITLGFNKTNTDEDYFKLVLHNISTKYTV